MGHKTVLLKLTQNMARNFLAILLCRDCFLLCAKKGNYLQVNSGTITHSLELMKNENMSYLELEQPRKKRKVTGGGVPVISNIFYRKGDDF